MKKFIKFLIAASLLLLLTLTAFATEWVLSEDESSITDGKVIYERYDTDFHFYDSTEKLYFYKNYASMSDGSLADVVSYAKENEIVWLYAYGKIIPYATAKGKANLDAFFYGVSADYKISDLGAKSANVEDAFLWQMFEGDGLFMIDAKELSQVEKYKISAHDKFGCFGYDIGAIFAYEGDYYALDYAWLKSENIGEDGSLLYDSGYITLFKVEGETLQKLRALLSTLTSHKKEYVWESESAIYLDGEGDESLKSFWVCYIAFGMVLPLAFGIVGVCFLTKEKRGRQKHWYLLTATAALWLVISSVLLVVIIL